ncbi:MAG: thiamine phosphate synthase [candidate division WOR-3 bacterium]
MSWECILDVNLNRLTESLKLLEDYIRFETKDLSCLGKIRKLRSEFLKVKQAIPVYSLVSHRKSAADPGRTPAFDRIPRKSGDDLLIANLSRAKESARIVEEIMRQRNRNLSKSIKKIRFEIYDIEKILIEKEYKKFNPMIYAIIDEKYLGRICLEKVIDVLQKDGATMLQLRIKTLSDRDFFNYAGKIRKLIRNPQFKFIINDRVDIASGVNADGVHLGKDDLSVKCARDILGDRFIIGASAHNLKEALSGQKDGADYLGVGAVFPTRTKYDAVVCGLDLIRLICKKVNIPVIGIGGINNKNCRKVINAGADGIAVASYLFEGNLRENLQSLLVSEK